MVRVLSLRRRFYSRRCNPFSLVAALVYGWIRDFTEWNQSHKRWITKTSDGATTEHQTRSKRGLKCLYVYVGPGGSFSSSLQQFLLEATTAVAPLLHLCRIGWSYSLPWKFCDGAAAVRRACATPHLEKQSSQRQKAQSDSVGRPMYI